jgi:hypothetical protein
MIHQHTISEKVPKQTLESWIYDTSVRDRRYLIRQLNTNGTHNIWKRLCIQELNKREYKDL